MEAASVLVQTLKPYEKNPRKSDIKLLKESLIANGQYKPIVVQKSTNMILAGNHVWQSIKELGWLNIDVVFVDVNDDAAKKIVLADNRISELGSYDETLLYELLKDIDLNGTGYTPFDIDDLLSLAEEQVSETKVPTRVESNNNERYAERAIRLLMCQFPNHQYVWVIDKLSEISKKLNVDSNADALLYAIADHTGIEVSS